jgi:protein-arginine kinase activator protein McsA
MSRTKPEFEAKHTDKQKDKDKASGLSCITDYKTQSNVHDIACRDCGKTFYTDEQTLRSFERAVQHDLDNPFVCYKCEQIEQAGTPFE